MLTSNTFRELAGFHEYLLWYSLTSLLALLYLISRLSDWLWASASRWLTTLHRVWASCQYLINRVGFISTLSTHIIIFIVFINSLQLQPLIFMPAPVKCFSIPYALEKYHKMGQSIEAAQPYFSNLSALSSPSSTFCSKSAFWLSQQACCSSQAFN